MDYCFHSPFTGEEPESRGKSDLLGSPGTSVRVTALGPAPDSQHSVPLSTLMPSAPRPLLDESFED